MRNRFFEIESRIIWSVIGAFFISLGFTWFMIAIGFNAVVQDILYPFSKYPIVVHTPGEIIMLPGLLFIWIITFMGVNHVLLTLFKHKFFTMVKQKLVLLIVTSLITIGVVFVLDIVLWPIAAKANGYSPCPYDTLLFGSKISTAWSKKETYCYDKGVKSRLSTGTFKQVVEVAKYLDSKKLDENQ